MSCYAGVAQLVRARGSYPRSPGFKSLHRHQFISRLSVRSLSMLSSPSESTGRFSDTACFRPARACSWRCRAGPTRPLSSACSSTSRRGVVSSWRARLTSTIACGADVRRRRGVLPAARRDARYCPGSAGEGDVRAARAAAEARRSRMPAGSSATTSCEQAARDVAADARRRRPHARRPGRDGAAPDGSRRGTAGLRGMAPARWLGDARGSGSRDAVSSCGRSSRWARGAGRLARRRGVRHSGRTSRTSTAGFRATACGTKSSRSCGSTCRRRIVKVLARNAEIARRTRNCSRASPGRRSAGSAAIGDGTVEIDCERLLRGARCRPATRRAARPREPPRCQVRRERTGGACARTGRRAGQRTAGGSGCHGGGPRGRAWSCRTVGRLGTLIFVGNELLELRVVYSRRGPACRARRFVCCSLVERFD